MTNLLTLFAQDELIVQAPPDYSSFLRPKNQSAQQYGFYPIP